MATEQIKFITQNIRAKYWGLVQNYSNYDHPIPINKWNVGNLEEPLQLRSIEALTDDEYLQVAKLIGWSDVGYKSLEPKNYNPIRIGEGAYYLERYKNCPNALPNHVFSYLTQIGIALPHLVILPNGETFTASVEWQIENNIIKI